ncbi:MAG: hypothetical protein HY704_06895 [Gemmatimonadetes bacterium]|nr:hypothetical protein [Gemmatimonadota bacterium]
MSRAAILIAALPFVSAGCFSYVAASAGDVPVGTAVRAHLSRDGAAKLRDVLGTDDQQVDGKVLGRDGEALYVGVPRRLRGEGYQERVLEQRVTVPVGDIVALEVRELKRTRTAAVVAAATAVTFAALLELFSGESGASSGQPTGGTEALVP